jgi:hypothetical protein
MKIRSDHVSHFFVCFGITGIGVIPYELFHKQWMVWIPLLLGLCAGFYKEFKDINTTGFDWTDIVADICGIATALFIWGLSMIGGFLWLIFS